MTIYKTTGRTGLFDAEANLEKLTKLGNPLEKLHKVIDFEMFRPELEEHLLNHDKKSNAGCKPHDVVLMFKIILLERFYNLSDEQAEYQINDRLSFKEFLGLSSGDRVPDSRTIWLFQDNLIQKDLEATFFEQFRTYLDNLGLFVNEGKIIDASFVEVPRQRNNKEENAKIKSGEGAELWKENPLIERAFKGKPLTDEQKESNHIKSKVRCRVEHPFGFVTNSMNDFYIKSIGFRRAKGIIGLINLVYNMCRYEQIVRLNLLPIKC